MNRALPLVLVLCSCAHCPPIKIDPVPLKGKQLTTSGRAAEPRIAWNGTYFGIVYLELAASGTLAEVQGMIVDRNGTRVTMASFSSPVEYDGLGYQPFRLSDLVWNPRDGQFAFAYAQHANAAWIARTNASLGVHAYTKVWFPGLMPGNPLPTPTDVSLTWNDAKREYGMAYVTREDPYANRHDDIYLFRLAPDGTIRNPGGNQAGGGSHTVNCPANCRRTSIAADAAGRYAIAYLELEGGSAKPHIGLVDEALSFGTQGGVHPVEVLERMPGGVANLSGMELYRDEANGDWFVAVATGIGVADGLRAQVLRPAPNWTLTPNPMMKLEGKYGPLFTVTNFFGGASAYEICFGDGQVRCRLGTATSLNTADWVTPPANASPRKSPSHVVVENAVYLVWIEDGNVFFGPVP